MIKKWLNLPSLLSSLSLLTFLAVIALANPNKIFAQQCIEERYHSPGSASIEGTYLFYCNQLSCTHSPDDQGNDVYALRCDNSNAIHIAYASGRVNDQCSIFPVGAGGFRYLPNGRACECLAYQVDWMSRNSSGNLVNVGWQMGDPPRDNCDLSPTPTITPTRTPTPSSSPTPTISPTITPTLTPTRPVHYSSCKSLEIISGNYALVPATVRFQASGEDSLGAIQRYRFYFGNGQQRETSSNQIEYRYESSGNFTARVEIQDSQGNWRTSDACQTTVTVKASSVESHRSDCSDLFITAGNGAIAPSIVNFLVTGYDNKGSLQAYRLNYGDGLEEEKTSNQFSKTYQTAGTYTVYAYIKDSHGNWKGGTGNCVKTLNIQNKPLVTQPKTGADGLISLIGIISGSGGLMLNFLRKRLS